MKDIEQKMHEDRINKEKNKSVQDEITKDVDFKQKLAKYNSSLKEPEKNNLKEAEKTTPKKLKDVENYLIEMNKNNNAKYNNIPKETKKINKIYGNQYLDQMIKENDMIMKRKIQEIIFKFTPNKIKVQKY